MARFIVVAAAVITLAGVPQAPDAARVLADMRQALGGDAALAGVKSFSLNGSLKRNLGDRTIQSDVDMICELPDKCVRVARQLGGPITPVITDGYNGDEPIREVDARLPLPPLMGPQDTSPEAVARRRAAQAGHNKEEFARLTIALFGASLAGYPLEFSYAGPDNVDGRAMDALEVKGGKDFSGRLLVDAATHLPVALIWKTPPIVMMTTSQTVMTRRSTGETREVTSPAIDAPRKVPPGAVTVTSTPTPDFVASLPLVERRRVFSDFKRVDSLMWPSRIKDFADGELAEDLKIDSIKLNPRIDPKRFTPSK
jgi:hypothetical protein